MKMTSTSIFHPDGSGTVKEQCAVIVSKLKESQQKTKDHRKNHKKNTSRDKRGSSKVPCKFCAKTVNLNYLKSHIANACQNKPADFDDNLPRAAFIKDASSESLSNSSSSGKSKSINDDDLYDDKSSSQKRFKPNHQANLNKMALLIRE